MRTPTKLRVARVSKAVVLLGGLAWLGLGLGAPRGHAAVDTMWGPNRGCMKVTATRRGELAQRSRPIAPRTEADAFIVRFRFRTTGPHTYAALLLVGLHAARADFKTNGAGVVIHRHSAQYGLVGRPFAADSNGEFLSARDSLVRLQYDTIYDVTCTYDPDQRLLSAEFVRLDGERPAGSGKLVLDQGVKFAVDRLAVWNYADGYPKVSRSSKLTVLVDNLQLDNEQPLTFNHDLSEMPEMNGSAGKWYQVPQPPLLSDLTGPRDLRPGEDGRFSVRVRPGEGRPVRIALTAFDGTVLLARECRVNEGKASAEFSASELTEMERGKMAVTASIDGSPERVGRAVCLRGRTLRNVLTEPDGLRSGDEVVVTDMGLFSPMEAASESPAKGVWWRRRFRHGVAQEWQEMLSVEEHDPAEPESCLAPSLRLPLRLSGWYEVWVTTFRPEKGGGIDVRLSDEPCYLHLNPQQVATAGGRVPTPGLVEMRFRSCDLTDRELEFRQPYGTYDSESKLCCASIAGVRLVKLSPEQVKTRAAEFADAGNQVLGFDNDGYSYFWRWGTHDRDFIARLLEPLRTPSASFLNLSLGGLGGLTIPTPYTELFQLQGHVRDGDFRANTFFRWCRDNDVNIVDVLAKRAHELGLKLFVSTMMERCYSPDRFVREHPEWRVKRGRGTWDYAKPEVRDYQVKKISWICANHDIDGFAVDYTRYGHYFNEDEPDKFGHMNAFVRQLRRGIDEVNASKERKVLLCASFGDRCWFLRNWGTGKLEDQGLDIQTWLREGIFDMLMPEGATCLDFVKAAEESRTQVWPRKVSGVTLDTDEKLSGKLGPADISRSVQRAFEAGAPGIFFFNHETWTSFGRLGIRDELPIRVIMDSPYALREVGKVTFAEWHPGFGACQTQRNAFSPLAAATSGGRLDGTCTVPVKNTFREPVQVQLRWGGEALARGLSVTPESAIASIEPGEAAELSVGLAGAVDDALRSDGMYADLSFQHEGRAVFRHRLPLRCVPQVMCELRPGAPAVFAGIGEAGDVPVEMAAGADALVLRWRCPAGQAEVLEPLPQDDVRGIRRRPNLNLLIDPAAGERSFLQFTVDPAGSQCEASWAFSTFHGKHLRKNDWNGEWHVGRDGDWLTVTLPFKTLGKTPEAGLPWRVAISTTEGGSRRSEWPAKHGDKSERFGLLQFR